MQNSIENRKNICFVANFYKTPVYHTIAQQLAKFGINTFWVVLKKEQETFLNKNYGIGNVLYLNRNFINKENEPICDVKINEILYGDRVLMNELDNGVKFLTNIQKPIFDFIKKNKISLVFGERTWGHEIVIGRMLSQISELKSSYYSFTSIRIPGERFSFFSDEIESKIVEPKTQEFQSIGAEFKVEKPSYLQVNDKIVRRNSSLLGRLNRVKRFFTNENIEKLDPNVIINPLTRIKITFKEELNRETYKILHKESFQNISNHKYVFLGFHKQPESSIDVLGRYFEDQAQNVINIWRLLPPSWKLVIKEHTNAIGDRGYNFYKRILKYPNIILIKETTDSHLLIRNSQLVFTVSGTIALEAALMNVPAVTLAPTFFNRINYCKYLTWTEIQKFRNLSNLISEIKSKENNIEEYKTYILKNSFEGNTSDIVSYPNVLDDENIKKVINAFLSII